MISFRCLCPNYGQPSSCILKTYCNEVRASLSSLIGSSHTMAKCKFGNIASQISIGSWQYKCITEGDMEIQVKTEPKESEDLNPSDCILAKIKKEIEEDFAINEALLFDDEEEEEEDSVVVKQEVGVKVEDHGASELAKQHDHLNSCPGSKTEGFKSMKVEDCDEVCDAQLLKSDASGSLVPPLDIDLAQLLSGILPVPTLDKNLAVDSSEEIDKKEEVKIYRPSLKSFGGKNGAWWKPNVRRWWQRRRVEDLRGKIKGRWTALDSMPKRKEEARTTCNREGSLLSRTFRRFGDDEKFKSVGWQREALVGKMIEDRCKRKDADARGSLRRPRKGDLGGKSVSTDGYLERRDRSRGMNDGIKTLQRRATSKRDEKVVFDVKKSVERECRLQDLQQKRNPHERKDLRRHSSTSSMSTGSNASESKAATLDTSLGLLTQHPLLPNVYILDPKAKK